MQILGPLRLWRGAVELDQGPRQQAYLLALLLAHEGRPISTTELTELIWDDEPPATALNIIQKHVGALRRLFEPQLTSRDAGSYLHRRGNSYVFTAHPGMLDLLAFRNGIAAAKVNHARGHHGEALDHYLRALNLWVGPAAAGLHHGPAAMAVFAALDAEFYDACADAAELAGSEHRPGEVLPALQLAASMAPVHEPVQAALIRVLGAAGRQAEALSMVRKVRDRLAAELGVGPSPALAAAHRQVLTQAPAGVEPPRTAERLIGRVEELAELRHTMQAGLTGGMALGIVEGEPGVGKTRLLEEAAAEAGRRGANVVWGRCLDGAGTPSMWPWVQMIRSILDLLPTRAREKWLAGELGRLFEPRGDVLAAPVLPDNGLRFRLFERVVAVIGEGSELRPLLLIIDDLQWADATSLELFGHLAGRLPQATVIMGAFRDRAPTPGSGLSRTLAAASRAPGHRRIRLGPLAPHQVAELVRRETGQEPGPDATRRIHARTAGNPFFVQELSRLLTGGPANIDDAVTHTGVPATVRDVVRDRMAGLDDNAVRLLRIAALIGRTVELSMLIRVTGLDLASCLGRLQPVKDLGLLEPVPESPFSVRFAHDLVRESVSEATPPTLASQLHLRIADAIEETGSQDESVPERLAYHLWSSGPLADPARTAAVLVRAGRHAATKSALEAAERHLRSAAQVARTAGLNELELTALAQLTAVVGMRSMYGFSSLELLERAEHLARLLGREVEAAGFLYSRWAAHAQAIELDRSGPLARRLLELAEASADPFVRACGLQAWGIHQWDIGNIGESFRYLSRSKAMVLDFGRREADPVRHDLQLLMTGMVAELTALHGDLDGAQVLLDVLENRAGEDPYMITVWATFGARIASIAGDPMRALRAAQRGIAADPDFSFVFLGTYQRLARCWASAMTGDDPEDAAAEAERIITTNLLDPPRSCVATWYGLLGEMRLASGATEEAATALDRADYFLETCGQRYPEGLLLLLRARLRHARGEPVAGVRAVAERARALSTDREAHLFARRAELFLAELDRR
ncbi:ATP-binding protein [Actinoplanes subtropicus]|uniref:ATP-binding protein n=1 Tax=Actinoplanes subtropicus TaxID=543632 RepID=UPI000690973E|nr:AAA family ATPase [Actinoplanes subtropicus]